MTENDSTFMMKCPNCYGAMYLEEDREFITCPYCGTQLKYEESDEVKQTRIKAQAQAQAEIEKQKIENAYKIKRDEVTSGAQMLKSGAQIVNEGARIMNEGAKVADTAKSIAKIFLILAIIGVISFLLVIGCIAISIFR